MSVETLTIISIDQGGVDAQEGVSYNIKEVMETPKIRLTVPMATDISHIIREGLPDHIEPNSPDEEVHPQTTNKS